MADNLGPVPALVAVPVGAPRTLAQDTLHYVAGAGLLGLSAWATATGLLDKQILATLIVAAAAGVGFKLKGN